MRLTTTLCSLFTLLGTITAAAADGPRVVTSIKPLYGLTAALMQGVGEPFLLIDGKNSPHGYSLRPSEARALSGADLVVWVGPNLESFLVEPLNSLAKKATAVTAMELDGITVLEPREGGIWGQHRHNHGHNHGTEDGQAHEGHNHDGHNHDRHDHDGHTRDGHADEEQQEGHEEVAHSSHKDEEHHDHGRIDPHVWLDPSNAIVIAQAAAKALSDRDPAHAGVYVQNLERLIASLEALDRALAEQLRPVEDAPYIVFHDAYHYFENRYGLSPVGTLTVSPESTPGARRVAELREILSNRGAVCIFSEPQFKPALIDSLAEGTDIGYGTLDPLGAEVPKGPDSYQRILTDLSASLAACLLKAG
ncbi:MAG: zinc ABC transporter substrate-binding protein [Rhodospirillales bacterium]|nr:zinc ABC transporter substrate-binding protein [Rhodospirillales bacterium]